MTERDPGSADDSGPIRQNCAEQEKGLNSRSRAFPHQEAGSATPIAPNTAVLDRRTDEEALRQGQKMEAVGQLAGGIAHDFNNLLTGIIGSLDLLQRRLADGRLDDVSRFASVATMSANRAATLTHRLLAFSRLQPSVATIVDINQLVASIEELLHRTISEAIDLRLALPVAVWHLECDPGQLENAILNLVINARDAMPDGGNLMISTGNAILDFEEANRLDVPPGPYAFVAVTDSGPGMAAEVIARVYEPFFTTKPVGVGTGLGLPMVYAFARQFGGGVQIESEMMRGTEVRIYLPRVLGEVDAGSHSAGHRAESPRGADEVVLVVEDDQHVRSLIMQVLQDHGYHGISATDGIAGLHILESAARIDLLITDVVLPGLNGRKLVKVARRRRPNLRALLISGYAAEISTAAHNDDGIQMLAKPFTIDQLLACIRQSASVT